MGSWVRAAALPVAAPADESINWTVTEPVDQNFTEYEAWRHKELGASADQPHRIKYKPLNR